MLGMLLRHWNVSAVYTLFCFGHERRLAITTAVDGLVGLLAMLLLVPVAWPAGRGARFARSARPPSACLATCERSPVKKASRWSLRSARFDRGSAASLLASAIVLLASRGGPTRGSWEERCLDSLVVLLYAVLMMPLLLRPPLGTMLAPRLLPWLALIPGLSRRLARHSLP